MKPEDAYASEEIWVYFWKEIIFRTFCVLQPEDDKRDHEGPDSTQGMLLYPEGKG